jgi:hypothetical protein
MAFIAFFSYGAVEAARAYHQLNLVKGMVSEIWAVRWG